MRAARLISLVLLLQSRGSMTGPDLAGELEVSERTVARDVLALAEAGVPVYAERGKHGGYRLLGGYRTRLTGLHRAEAEALLLAAIPGPAAEMGLTGEVASARRKITAALAPGVRDAPERVSRRFHLDAPGWFRSCGTPPLLGELAEAVWQDRSVRAVYRRGDREVRREVEPHGLVLKAGAWYVACRVGQRFLVYRADRFRDVELAGPFDRDESFDLPGFWEQRSEDFARSLLRDSVTVRLTPAGVRALPVHLDRFAAEHAEHAEHAETDEQGLVTATLPVESLDVAYDQLLALGPEVEVLAPPELRKRMARAAARFAALYAEARDLTQVSGTP